MIDCLEMKSKPTFHMLIFHKQRSSPLRRLGTTLLCCLISGGIGFSQIPVGAVVDSELLIPNTTNSVVEGTHLFLLEREKPLQETINDVQAFFSKASTIVNGAILNMRMIKKIVELEKDIVELYGRSLSALNGDQDNDFLDKWKHAQILLALVKESASVFELFETLIEDDAMTINDKGRIMLIEKTYQDMRKIKAAMRLQLRRINKEIYQYRRLDQEIQTFEAFFENE